MARSRTALIAIALMAVAALVPASANATFPGANGRIAYPSYGAALHTVLPSGHGDRVIAPRGGTTAWSPNGLRLAFDRSNNVGHSDIYTMRADGSGVQRLTTDGEDPVFGDARDPGYSPGGGRIVFEHAAYHAPTAIATMRNDGSDRHDIADADSLGASLYSSTWSPAGEIAYVQRDEETNLRASIWAMRPDGTNKHRLVYLGGGARKYDASGGYGPIYSPDGSEFLFVRIRDDGSVHTMLADEDGSNIRPSPCKALSTATMTPSQAGLFPVTYSPDGKWILAENRYFNGEAVAANLVRIRLSSCEGHRVVGRTSRGAGADWQPVPNG